jgi:8-oxo-dGTP pyrophosphatase MutT (NUDIX family)
MPRLRVAAYGVCVDQGRVLLARWVPPDGSPPLWTMPGGGMEHGEDPVDALVREFAEETGHQVVAGRLLGIHSWYDADTTPDRQSLRIVYEARITGGELRDEVGGSTDRAQWFDLAEVPGLDRVPLVDIALELHRTRPVDGRPRSHTAAGHPAHHA